MRRSKGALAVSLLLATGCATVEQATECADYISCLVEVSPAAVGEAIEYVGPEGSCWDQPDPAPDQCAQACLNGVKELRTAFPDEAACR